MFCEMLKHQFLKRSWPSSISLHSLLWFNFVSFGVLISNYKLVQLVKTECIKCNVWWWCRSIFIFLAVISNLHDFRYWKPNFNSSLINAKALLWSSGILKNGYQCYKNGYHFLFLVRPVFYAYYFYLVTIPVKSRVSLLIDKMIKSGGRQPLVK